jgi:phosphotransferase system enzyme I (PtsI)
MGSARVILPGSVRVAEARIPVSGVADEMLALEQAVEQTVAELRELRETALKRMGGTVAKIFDAQLLIASDYEFIKEVKEEIANRRRNAGFIYNQQVRKVLAPLKKSPDRYMRQTASDIEAVASRVLSQLTGYEKCDLNFPPNTILVGKNFSPSDLLGYRQRKSIGFVVSEGGNDSHMALIARSLMLPVVQAPRAWTTIPNNVRLIIDGTSGKIIVEPSDKDWADYQKLKKRQGPALIARIRKLRKIPPETMDGQPVNIAANVSLPGPADDIIAAKGIPVGLYRTEFMYLAANEYPDEDAQYETYRQISEKFNNSYVVVRTFDLGYDKTTPENGWPEEANPALGWRGIRAMLDMAEVFKTQVRAILRASTSGNLRLMLPMVTDLSEIERARKLIGQAKLSLKRRGQPFDENIQLGIMVEVPSAALIADTLATKVDFMSIGTNDLTQYTMASDRTNRKVAELYNPLHPSILHLIDIVVKAGRNRGIPVSICGEIAGELLALPLFIGMGVDTLSMSPHRISDICRAVKKIDSRLVKHLAPAVLASDSIRSVRRKLENYREEIEKVKASA